MKILFVLQNAYNSEKYNFKNEQEWEEDLQKSHTGRRLLEMVPPGADIVVVNASKEIGDNPDSLFPADPEYIQSKIDQHHPDCICACGVVAQNGLKALGHAYIPTPHPAYRALSKQYTAGIRSLLQALTVLKDNAII